MQAKETPGAGAKKEIAESTAPKVDAVEVQVTLDFQKFFIQSTSGFFVTILAFVFLAERRTASETYSLNALQMRYDACVIACI